MKRVMTAVLAVLLLATVSIGGALPVYAETAHAHTAYAELGLGADLPEAIGPDPSGYEGEMSMPPLNAQAISSYADFKSMEPGGSYYLTCDLRVYETYEETFTGNLYGNGYTITTDVPLFKKMERSIVTDLVIEGEIEYYGTVGALAVEAVAPELHNVINYASVTTTVSSSNAGGLFGKVLKSDFATVFNYCENHGDVYGTSETGGFVGYMQGTYDEAGDAKKTSTLVLIHCLNTGNITSENNEAAGFVAQPGGGNSDYEWLYSVTVQNCANKGNITAKTTAGGLIGEVHAGHVTVDACYNTGVIEAINTDAAGIVARTVFRGVDSTVAITNCYNTGDVQATGDVAGILGEGAIQDTEAVGGLLVIDNCQNDGAITGNRTGGILGTANENPGCAEMSIEKVYIKNCTNDGNIHSTTNYGGGIAARTDLRTVDSEIDDFRRESVVFEGCVNNGDVMVYTSQTGGMVGFSSINTVDGVHGEYNMGFYGCVNNGDIKTAADGEQRETKIGGMLGYTGGGARFYGCVNNGLLCADAGDSTFTGGMAAWVERRVVAESCISAGDIYGGRYIGGIVGATRSSAITDGAGVTVSYDEHRFVGNLVTADITEIAWRAPKHDKTTGGLAGYLWGDAVLESNAVISNITGTYDDPLEDGFAVSAFIGKLGGDAYLTATANYFCGTLEAGTYGSKVLYANAPDSTQAAAWDVDYNYTTVQGLLTYLAGKTPSFAFASVPDGVSDSASFLSVMNSETIVNETGEELFVTVTSCEGDVLTLYKGTSSIYDLARLHADEDCDYFTVVKHDGDYHWMACATCGAADLASIEEHCAAEGEKATCHTELVCAECGASFGGYDLTNHEDAEIEWITTPTTHSAVTDCCGTIEAEGHEFEGGVCLECGYTCLHTVTCGQGAVCELCGETFNGTATHTWSTGDAWKAVDAEDKHYRYCTGCGAIDPDSGVACSESDYPADCLNYQICTACGQDFGELDETCHVYSNRFTYEPNADDPSKCEKRYACCDAVAELVDHVEKSAATCCDRAVCANCNWYYGEIDASNHESDEVIYRVNETDPEKHDMVYVCCEHAVTEAHTGGEASCTERARCTLCQSEYGSINSEHAFDHKCDTQCNDCGMLRSTDGHAFGGWLIEQEATETEAGYQMRACVICGAVQKATIAPVTNPDSALLTMPEETVQSDAYIGVIVIAAAGALVLGVIVGVIVHKKKKAK